MATTQAPTIHHQTPPAPASTGVVDLQDSPGKRRLTIEEEDDRPEERVARLVAENPVVVLSGRACCMCYVMRRLLSTVGVHPTVVELDPQEIEAAMGSPSSLPVVFIGGELVGGLERLMELHLGGRLVPRLREVGALWA